MLLIAGLGNPGGKYAGNRHNIGFMAVDRLHDAHGFGPWRQKFQAEISEGTIAGERVLLMKPLTYMNESGRAVGEAARFHKIPLKEIIVIHDELDLPSGKMRVKTGGGHGGHNGLKSLDAHLGKEYRRIRLGIGHPGDKALVHNHVLGDFAKADQTWLGPLLDAISDNAALLVKGEDESFASKVHLATAPAKAPKAKANAGAKPSAASIPSTETQQPADKNSMTSILRGLLANKPKSRKPRF
ncbi:Peptidyl-tRNA hydrolase [Hartmannibacter diazotrophicus]|uniref:Peptidyl-tRNA hydrolase n=1 Tax=Hartmannibacter diazotrophicus TaxID=1482074 RepID=A0A2C9DA75_9HYPH|nr:Peptidyl-tRNA hydrolase [Hartmannibacter diazotrophicus]